MLMCFKSVVTASARRSRITLNDCGFKNTVDSPDTQWYQCNALDHSTAPYSFGKGLFGHSFDTKSSNCEFPFETSQGFSSNQTTFCSRVDGF